MLVVKLFLLIQSLIQSKQQLAEETFSDPTSSQNRFYFHKILLPRKPKICQMPEMDIVTSTCGKFLHNLSCVHLVIIVLDGKAIPTVRYLGHQMNNIFEGLIKLVLSVHVQMVLKFLSSLVKKKIIQIFQKPRQNFCSGFPSGVPSTDQPDKTSTVRTSTSYRSTAL
jgi:hypothetical protein